MAMVAQTGLEPVHSLEQRILNPQRLPFRHWAVLRAGVEPAYLAALAPQASVSAFPPSEGSRGGDRTLMPEALVSETSVSS
jgi:hypothetical protein